MNWWPMIHIALIALAAIAVAIAVAALINPKPAKTVDPQALNINVRIMQKCYAIPQRTRKAGHQFTEASFD